MKLFSKYNRINILSTVIIFLLGCIAFAILLRYVIIRQVDGDLEIEKNEITVYVNQYGYLPGIIKVHDQYITYQTIDKTNAVTKNKIYTHKAYVSANPSKVVLRSIEFTININNTYTLVTVSKSLESVDALMQTIILITIALILLILTATFVINRIILGKLWRPFYETLDSTQQFSLNNTQPMRFNDTDIDEFSHLNTILNGALNKAQQDYRSLKEFTENASHELQTPVAIIKSRLDNLIQDENLTLQQSHAVEEAYNALNRLNKLNQSLLLLTKIENKQFATTTQINLKEKTENKLNQFCELWQGKNIKADAILEEANIKMNENLADMLLNNLLSNAAKHNIQNGSVEIHLKQNLFTITNTGLSNPLDENLLFTRFYKTNADSESNGLGLSIVKQICNVSACTIAYSFSAPDKHSFILKW